MFVAAVLQSEASARAGCADMRASRGMGSMSPEKMSCLANGGPVGLYANINAKRNRIAAGSGEKMRKPGSPGAPTAKAFKDSAKTAKAK